MEIIPPLAVILVVVLCLLVRVGTRLSDLDARHYFIIKEKIMMIELAENDFVVHLVALQQAIASRNRQKILHLYDEINAMDFSLISDVLLVKYDRIVEKGNHVLYEEKASYETKNSKATF